MNWKITFSIGETDESLSRLDAALNAGGRARLEFAVFLPAPAEPPPPSALGPGGDPLPETGSGPPLPSEPSQARGAGTWAGPDVPPPLDPNPLSGVPESVGSIKPGSLSSGAKPSGTPAPSGTDSDPLAGISAAAGAIKPGSLSVGTKPSGSSAPPGTDSDPLAGIS
ncbi:MAG: hypothetical protein LBQ12_02090, partial [Deltaproteobacteria bacterium]|nr:hypothetical protein [Deltaproteobacteria bacterium]